MKRRDGRRIAMQRTADLRTCEGCHRTMRLDVCEDCKRATVAAADPARKPLTL